MLHSRSTTGWRDDSRPKRQRNASSLRTRGSAGSLLRYGGPDISVLVVPWLPDDGSETERMLNQKQPRPPVA